MNHLDYILFLEERDQHCKLSGNDYKVYIKLVQIAKIAGWPATFARSDASLQKACNIQENTIRACRERLEAAGLIATTQTGKGRNAATSYALLNTSNFEALPELNTSNFEVFNSSEVDNASKFEALSPANTSNFEALPELNASKFEVLTIISNKEVDAASAATLSPAEKEESSLSAASPKKPAGKKNKGASAEEIAALELPHPGKEFADLWAGFVAGPKQQGKTPLAFRLLLKKLAKYEEGYALVMLEKAIEGNWSGVEYDSTPTDYAKWQAEQTRLAAQQPAASTPIDRDTLFGFSQSASAGLAQARNTPEYQAYLAQKQAQATTPA